MIKVRLQGLPNEIDDFIEDFKKKYHVLSVSDKKKNRQSQFVRVYVEVKINE